MDALHSLFNSLTGQPTVVTAGRLHEALYDAAAKASGTAIIGLILHVTRFSVAWAFMGHSAGTFGSRLVINVSKAYDLALYDPIERLSERAWEVVKNAPNIRLYAMLLALALSVFSPTAGLVVGTGVGVFGALIIDREMCHKRQNNGANQPPSVAGFMQQVL